MSKIYRIMGERGRITIPEDIRNLLNIRGGDVLSFVAEDNSVIISKEKLCDNYKTQVNQFEALIKFLTKDERDKLFRRLMKHKRNQYI